jgi:hypothetical protein
MHSKVHFKARMENGITPAKRYLCHNGTWVAQWRFFPEQPYWFYLNVQTGNSLLKVCWLRCLSIVSNSRVFFSSPGPIQRHQESEATMDTVSILPSVYCPYLFSYQLLQSHTGFFTISLISPFHLSRSLCLLVSLSYSHSHSPKYTH